VGSAFESVFVADTGVTLVLTTTRRTAHCPLCARRSRRVHSRYQRTLADLPWPAEAPCCTSRCVVSSVATDSVRALSLPSDCRSWLRRAPDAHAPTRVAARSRLCLGRSSGSTIGHKAWSTHESRNVAAADRASPAAAGGLPHACLEWMTGVNGVATPMARSWWMPTSADPSSYSKIAQPPPLPAGLKHIPASRS